MSLFYRAIAGLIGVSALAVQYALLLNRFDGDAGLATLRFFTYFTLLSNIVGAIAFLAPALALKSAVGQFFAKPAVRTAATLYLLVVGAVYHAVLASQWDPRGLQLAADIVLHTLMPIAMLADWIFLTGKRDLRLSMIPAALIFPFAYGIWALALGSLNGFYPYPFLDAAILGYPAVAFNLAVLIAVFGALGSVMVLVGCRLATGLSFSRR